MPEPAAGRLPTQLTSFVGRHAEVLQLKRLLDEHRMVTLTGPGGVGKTRLALELARHLAGRFADCARWVDLAPITDPDLVSVQVSRALGLPDQPGRATVDNLTRCIADRPLLLVLDNCERLLDACAALVTALVGACPGLTILATSREPIGVVGEVTWRTPSLSLADEAVELFTVRAQLVRPDFCDGDDQPAIAEICRRLDGLPLAIELAAARVRTLSPREIIDGLHDRFRLLTGGARTAVARQQTLRASVDWSYALLTEPERVLFRRLAVFLGGFDADAAHAVAAETGAPRHQTLDGLCLLVDKSLVIAENHGQTMRYWLLATVRDYALARLGEAGETDATRTRHRDHYTALFDTSLPGAVRQPTGRAELEIDNLRAAFVWSRENGDAELAARLASALQPLWLRGRVLEGQHWLNTALAADLRGAPAARAGGLADRLMLDHLAGTLHHLADAEKALAIAGDLGDPALLARALTAAGLTCCYSPEHALPYFAEAITLARSLADDWQLSQILGWQAYSAFIAGDLVTARAAAAEGVDLAEAAGDGLVSRLCRWCMGLAQWVSGNLAEAATQAAEVAAEARAAQDPMFHACGLMLLAAAQTYQGDTTGAQESANAAVEAACDLPGFQQGAAFGALADAALAAGEVATAVAAAGTAHRICPLAELWATNTNPVAKAALAGGDLAWARRSIDDAIAVARGVHRMVLLASRMRVAIGQDDLEQADRDGYDALAITTQTDACLMVPDILECLAALAARSDRHLHAARLLGAAAAIRSRTGQVRFQVYDAEHAAFLAALRDAMGQPDYETAWADGAALSPAEAVAYAQRGRGERRRAPSGWVSLTPAELEVAGLAGDGLSNKDIAARLFVSPRTVQAHLTHVYTKLGLASRVQLAHEVRRQR